MLEITKIRLHEQLLRRLLTEEYVMLGRREDGSSYLIVDGWYELTPEERETVESYHEEEV